MPRKLSKKTRKVSRHSRNKSRSGRKVSTRGRKVSTRSRKVSTRSRKVSTHSRKVSTRSRKVKKHRSHKDGSDEEKVDVENIERIPIEQAVERFANIDDVINLLEKIEIGPEVIPKNISNTHKIGEQPEYLLREQLKNLIIKRDEFDELVKKIGQKEQRMNKLRTKSEIEKAESEQIIMSEYISNFDKELRDLCKKLRKDLDYATKLYNIQIFQAEKNISIFEKNIKKNLEKQLELDSDEYNFREKFSNLGEKIMKFKIGITSFGKYIVKKKAIMKETIRPSIKIVNNFCNI